MKLQTYCDGIDTTIERINKRIKVIQGNQVVSSAMISTDQETIHGQYYDPEDCYLEEFDQSSLYFEHIEDFESVNRQDQQKAVLAIGEWMAATHPNYG